MLTASYITNGVRVGKLLFNGLRPEVYLSHTGSLRSMRPWDIKTSTLAVKNVELVMKDIDLCVKENPDYFVSVMGFNKDEVVEQMYLVHSPSIRAGQSCSITGDSP